MFSLQWLSGFTVINSAIDADILQGVLLHPKYAVA